MARISIEDDGEGHYQVSYPYNEDCNQDMKSDFGARFDRDQKCWLIPSDAFTEQDIEKVLKLHFPRDFR